MSDTEQTEQTEQTGPPFACLTQWPYGRALGSWLRQQRKAAGLKRCEVSNDFSADYVGTIEEGAIMGKIIDGMNAYASSLGISLVLVAANKGDIESLFPNTMGAIDPTVLGRYLVERGES